MKKDDSKEMYEKTSQAVEKLSETIIGTMKVSFHVFVWPAFITTVLNYFTKDLGPDAFEMPFPMRYSLKHMPNAKCTKIPYEILNAVDLLSIKVFHLIGEIRLATCAVLFFKQHQHFISLLLVHIMQVL